ncbi:methionine ABC transporter permease [Brevibacillus fulvus]|uniref:D-methionine transport system permease protein n=1 Tax=Brevibacillus fulvus TaxID=1125967 RepID=A0A938XS12_9BACL|nr:methionine ABC transporter permease [Brevibacillus fulvus]MBM7588847.1 D-methionine transport system permease protein [Brevibacillus fulvus]
MFLEQIVAIIPDLNKAFSETFLMMSISVVLSAVFGIPLGILLFVTDNELLAENRWINRIAGFVVNVIRSTPFVILLVALIPLTSIVAGTIVGPKAATVPLAVAAIPFYARLVESSLKEINKGVIEAAIAMGSTLWHIIFKILLVEARSGLILGLTVTTISLLGFSAMAGIVGGGGIGDLAIRFGYYRFDNVIMFTTVVILIVIVQVIQAIGDKLAKRLDKR